MNLEQLERAGIDTESLLRRLMGNASLIRLFVGKFLQDGNFALLQEAFGKGDMQQAEYASHTLKGMCGNLSLKELYPLFTRQVELLRCGDCAQAQAMMEPITRTFEATTAALRAWLAEN